MAEYCLSLVACRHGPIYLLRRYKWNWTLCSQWTYPLLNVWWKAIDEATENDCAWEDYPWKLLQLCLMIDFQQPEWYFVVDDITPMTGVIASWCLFDIIALHGECGQTYGGSSRGISMMIQRPRLQRRNTQIMRPPKWPIRHKVLPSTRPLKDDILYKT